MRRFLPFLGLILLLVSCQLRAQSAPHRHVVHPVKHHVKHHAKHHDVKHRKHHRVTSVHREKSLPPIPWSGITPYVVDPQKPLVDVSVDAASVRCLANVILYEARGEPVRGQIGVANVVLRRTKLPQYPDSVCGVIHQSARIKGKRRCQFSWVCHRPKAVFKPNVRARAERLATLALLGRLPNVTGNADSFHSIRVKVKRCGRPMTIGGHVFCSNTPNYLAKETHEPNRVSEQALAL